MNDGLRERLALLRIVKFAKDVDLGISTRIDIVGIKALYLAIDSLMSFAIGNPSWHALETADELEKLGHDPVIVAAERLATELFGIIQSYGEEAP